MKDAFKATDPPWNADGTGSTYVTRNIQKCLNAAKAKHVDVYIPSGTYLVRGTLTIPGGVAVFGDGPDEDGTTLLHALDPDKAATNLLNIDGNVEREMGRDVHISGLCLSSKSNKSKHAIHASRTGGLRIKDVRIVQYKSVRRPWEVGLWLEGGLQNEFYNLLIEDCSDACLYFNRDGKSTTTQLFQNCRFRQGGRGIFAEDKATITTRFIGCTVEACTEAAVKVEGVCGMTWVDPHVELVPLNRCPYPIFDLGPGSIVNIYGGRLGGHKTQENCHHPDSSIFRIDNAKSINLNGVALHYAGKIFDVELPPDQLIMSGVFNESVDKLGELSGIGSLHISGCTL